MVYSFTYVFARCVAWAVGVPGCAREDWTGRGQVTKMEIGWRISICIVCVGSVSLFGLRCLVYERPRCATGNGGAAKEAQRPGHCGHAFGWAAFWMRGLTPLPYREAISGRAFGTAFLARAGVPSRNHVAPAEDAQKRSASASRKRKGPGEAKMRETEGFAAYRMG